MLPNPDLWARDPIAVRSSTGRWSMPERRISFSAPLTMFVAGWRIGWRKTLIFLRGSSSVSLGFELIRHRHRLAVRQLRVHRFPGHESAGTSAVDDSASWFYMGLASYLDWRLLADRFGHGQTGVWCVLAGAWLLTGWDLVLDPAMAHESLRVQFWVWEESRPYFGMPLKNLAGLVADRSGLHGAQPRGSGGKMCRSNHSVCKFR